MGRRTTFQLKNYYFTSANCEAEALQIPVLLKALPRCAKLKLNKVSKLKYNRERLNLTQEELAAKSGVSVRTIQRIESGIEPKGHTLKVLSTTLNLDQKELISKTAIQKPTANPINYPVIKIINLSALPVSFIPPLNILFPLVVMFIKKEFSAPAKQLVSVQIVWTVISFIIFMLSSFLKNWYSLGSRFSLIVMTLLVLTNMAVILVNAAAIDRNEKLAVKLNFSFL